MRTDYPAPACGDFSTTWASPKQQLWKTSEAGLSQSAKTVRVQKNLHRVPKNLSETHAPRFRAHIELKLGTIVLKPAHAGQKQPSSFNIRAVHADNSMTWLELPHKSEKRAETARNALNPAQFCEVPLNPTLFSRNVLNPAQFCKIRPKRLKSSPVLQKPPDIP